MAQVILVEPCGDGWRVRSEHITSELTYRSGREAEDAAKRLGAKCAEGGDRAEIRIYLRGGALAGRFICTPTRPSDFRRGEPCGGVSIALKLAS
jgi:hypothetical protein